MDKTNVERKQEASTVTRTWKVYGSEGNRQRESFAPSVVYDWSCEKEGTRIVEVINSDRTGTNNFCIVRITRNSAELCEEEFEGQLTDGIFENCSVGYVEEIR